jgi:hypothetical protein
MPAAMCIAGPRFRFFGCAGYSPSGATKMPAQRCTQPTQQRISNTLGETRPGTEYLAAHVSRRESHFPRHHPMRRIAWALTSGSKRLPKTWHPVPKHMSRSCSSRHEPTLDLGRVRPIRMVTLTFASQVGHRCSKAKSRGDTPGYGNRIAGMVGLHTMVHLSLCRIYSVNTPSS